MKRKLLSMAVALLCSVGTWAQAYYNQAYTEGVTVAAGGEYFLYNIGAGQFLTSGMAWGTHATVDNSGRVLKLTASDTGYKIYTQHLSLNNRTESKEGYLFANTDGVWTDNTTIDDVWYIEAVSVVGYTKAYTIKKDASTYLQFNSSDCNVNVGSNTGDSNSYWLLIPKSTREAAGDYGHYLINTQMNSPWEWKTWSGSTINNSDVIAVGGLTTNRCGEKYHEVKDIYQDIKESVPNGKYTLYAQAFWRQDGSSDGPVLYANGDSQLLAVLNANSEGTAEDMNGASTSFTSGLYVNNVSTIVTDNTLRVGINITDANQWVIFDNFYLEYLGTTLINDAVAVTTGSTTAADKWYYYDIPTTEEYEFTSSAAATLTYTTDGTQLTSGATGTSSTFTAAETKTISLSAGRLYFKTSAATTLNVTYKYNVGAATLSVADGGYTQSQTFTVTFPAAMSNDPAASAALVASSTATVNGSSVSLTAATNGFSLDLGTLTTSTNYVISIPAGVYGYSGQSMNEAISVTIHTPAVFDGTYYLYDAANSLYLGRGCAWGTEATMDKYGIPVILSTNSSNVSSFQFVDNSLYLFEASNGIFTDNASTGWTLSSATGGYVLTTTDGTKYLTHDSGGYGEYVHLTTTSGDATVWTLQSVSDHNTIVNAYPTDNINNVISAAGVSDAVTTAGSFTDYLETLSSQDMTSVIGTATFGSDAGDWTYTQIRRQGDNDSDWPVYNNGYARMYQETGTFTQTISAANLPAGIYKVKMAGFDRRSTNDVDNAMATNYESVCSSYLKANGEQVRITPWKTMVDAAYAVDATTYADSWAGQAASMTAGYADNVLYIYLDGNTDLTLTVAKPNYCSDSYMCFGNFTLTYYTTDLVAANKTIIQNNNGDITSLINGTFDSNADGWTFVNDKDNAATTIARYNGSSWRGGNNYYVDCNNRWYTISTTLNHMPAGTYKLVAAMRGKSFGIRPSLAGTDGSYFYGTNDTMINTNGVQMPVSDITKNGMNYASDGTQWNWITLTANLAADGDLVIAFKLEANSDCWACLDDVHLYCTELDGTSYTKTLPTISGNTDLSSYADGSVITCDITVSNPNAMMYSGNGNDITTAAGTSLNNFMFKKSGFGGTYWAAKVVLYDGYAYSSPENEKGLYFDNARLYRTFPADQWCTLVLPFWPNDANFTKMYPSELSDAGVLTFSEATNSTWDTNDKPMLVKSSAAVNVITGGRKGTGFAGTASGSMTSGEGVNMNGTYSVISAVPEGSYVVARADGATEDALYKVNSTVSLAPFRAYFSIPEESGVEVKANVIRLNFGDTETGIAEIGNGEVKAIVNGPIFNLAGQRLDHSQLKRGIYIVGGKKVLVK